MVYTVMKCILLIDPSIALFSIQGSQPLENGTTINIHHSTIHQLWPVLHGYTDGWFCEPTEAAITDQPISDIQKLKYISL